MERTQTSSTETIKNLLTGFQSIIENWREQFDHPPQLELDFYVDPAGMLCVNDVTLCPVCDIESPDSLISQWDMFFLKTNTGDTFDFLINWPFDGPPEITRIVKSRDIYVRPEAS